MPFRHLTHHWRFNLATLVCLTLASALMASLSGYATAVSAQALDRSLEAEGPAGRSLLLTGNLDTYGAELYADLRDRLGSLLKDRLVIRHAVLSPEPRASSEAKNGQGAVASLDVYSFDDLAEHVQLVEGRLPAQADLGEAAGNWPPPVEAVIGCQAAEQSGYDVGDRLNASGMYHRLDIVGIVEPLDPDDDLWGGDLGAFVVASREELGAGAIALPLIIAPESMRSYLGRPIFPHAVSWRISLHRQRIGPAKAGALYSNLVSFQTQTATKGIATSTGLLETLDDFLGRQSRLRVALWLVSVQSLILILYALGMYASFVADWTRVEMETLSARGMSIWQITRAAALEDLVLALPVALLLGPGLAQLVAYLWKRTTGTPWPSGLSAELMLLSAVAAGAGWLVLVVSTLLTARRCSREPRARRIRPPQQSGLHRRYVDLYLLASGGLLVWQLNRSGSFLARAIVGTRLGSTPLADPLLLLGPYVLLSATVMVLLRLVPALLRLAARPFQRQRGLALPLGLLRASRNPQQASRPVLLISLAAGLMLFARIFRDSLAFGQDPLRSDALTHGIAGAFQLDALMLVVFSVATFFLVSWMPVRRRGGAPGSVSEFGVLRAMGLPMRQWPVLFVMQGVLVLVVGLLAGLLVGFGLSHAMIPYLSQVLIEPLAGAPITRIVVDWPAIAHLCLLLLALHGSALAALWLVLRHGRLPSPRWTEDE